MKKVVLICGLIRKIEILKQSLEIYNRLIKENIIDEIILCTDYKNNSNKSAGTFITNDIKEMLQKSNVKIIEHESLSLNEIKKIDPKCEERSLCRLRKKNIFISIWKEAYNFKMGLINCPDNSFILKTRCDLFLSYNLIKKIFNNYIKKLPENNIFDYKIWAGGFGYCEPLYLSDYAFMGYKKDLLKTVSLDGQHLNWNNLKMSINTSDTLWWIPIFYKKYPIIKSFFENIVGKYKSLTLIENEIFYKTIATSIFILNKYFIIDSGVNDYILYPAWGGIQIKNSVSHFSNYPIQQNSEWIQNFINGKFNSNKIMKLIFNEYQLLN